MSNIFEEYIQYHNGFQKKYGKKTMVLMQVGSFYEGYATNEKGPNLIEISDVLNIVCTRRDKSINIISDKNPYMLGFPMISSTKFINLLIENGYTVIMIDQTTPPPNPKREITGIYSPGTYIEGVQKPDTNYTISIYIEEEVQKNAKPLMCCGMSAIDLTIGKVILNESLAINTDEKISIDEVLRFINSLNPKEIIINHKKKDTDTFTKEHIIEYLDLDNRNYHYNQNLDKKYLKLSYQNEVLKKIYSSCGMISPIEYLDMEKLNYARIALLALIDFAYDHNEKIIFNLDKPEIYTETNHLIMGNNAIYQLNIVESDIYQLTNQKIKSLFDVVNNTSTALGRRLLKERLLYPLTSEKELNKIYSDTENIIKDNLYLEIEKNLREISDLERLERKLSLQILQPYELHDLISSLEEIININIKLASNKKLEKILLKKEIIEKVKEFIEKSKKDFNLEELKKQNLTDISNSFFNQNYSKDLDKLVGELNLGHDFMDLLCSELSKLIDEKTKFSKSKGEVKISVKKNDRDGYYLTLTKLRANMLKKKLDEIKTIKINNLEIESNKLVFKDNNNNSKIIFPDLEKKSDEMVVIRDKIISLVKKLYIEKLQNIYSENKEIFRVVSYFVAYLDYVKSNAKTSKIYNYCKPQIKTNKSEKNSDTSSYLKVNNLRHPIIERIIEHEYIPHDIEFSNKLKGMLIFGVNACGKSSIMKAVGCCVVMAQAGLFVPATSCEISLFKSLYTRITGNDNIFKGLSSFALEMVELKSILNRANENSLVIGDEVCRGTEHISGNAIVASTIINLEKTNSCFIFATHLHELIKMDRIKKLEKVKPFHLEVHYDPKLDTIIYDRKLKEGSGDNIYGITVARHIIHDKDFIDLAIEIKNELLNQKDSLISGKISNYNSEVYIHECQICHEKDTTGYISPLETHHINFQKDCVDGFVKNKSHIKKNDKCNLIVLCQKCHDKIHNGKLNIEGYMMTSKGKQIKIKKSNNI